MKSKLSISIITTFMLALCLFAGFSSAATAKAANGPSTGKDSYCYIKLQRIYGGDIFFDNIFLSENIKQTVTKVDGLSYDKKTNTLTLTNFKSDADLCANEMGDDFTINIIGDCAVSSILAYGYHYGGSITFAGSGKLTIGDGSSTALFLYAEDSASKIIVKAGPEIVIKSNKSAISGIQTTVKNNFLVLEDGVTSNATFESAPFKAAKLLTVTDGEYNYLFHAVKKDNKVYYVNYTSTLDDDFNMISLAEIYETKKEGSTLISDYEMVKKQTLGDNEELSAYGYEVVEYESGSYNYTCKQATVTIGTGSKPVTATPGKPAISVKQASGKVTLELKATDNAKGYVIYMKTGNGSFKKIATVKKDGTKLRTYTVKNLKAGKYTFKVRAYTKVDGKTVYGKYSNTAAITVK